MKKFERVFIVVLSLLFVISLAGCSQSEAAKAVDEQIEAIGEVTLSSLPKIEAAEKAYQKLEEVDRKQVKQYINLVNARETYSQMRADKAIDYINDIGEVNINSAQKIDTAKNYFNGLSRKEQALVINRETIEKAKSEYDIVCATEVEQLIEQAINDSDDYVFAEAYIKYNMLSKEQKALLENYKGLKILEVVHKISEIGEVSLGNTEAVKRAQYAYNDLSYDEKEKVSNKDILYAALKKINELNEQVVIALSQRIQEEYDEVTGITCYTSANHPPYKNLRSYVLPYITTKEYSDTMNLHIVYNYAGIGWIFFENAIIVTDTHRYYKTFDYFDVIREASFGAMLSERLVVDASKSDIDMLRDMASSEKTIVRLQGDTYYYDINLSMSDKQGIADILALYDIWIETQEMQSIISA